MKRVMKAPEAKDGKKRLFNSLASLRKHTRKRENLRPKKEISGSRIKQNRSRTHARTEMINKFTYAQVLMQGRDQRLSSHEVFPAILSPFKPPDRRRWTPQQRQRKWHYSSRQEEAHCFASSEETIPGNLPTSVAGWLGGWPEALRG